MKLNKVDGLRFVRKNPKMFLSFAEATGVELCGKLLIDAISGGTAPIVVDRQKDWWIVAAQKNWVIENPDGIPVDELFKRIHPNPRAGANAMRNEILLAAFADQIVLFQNRKFEIIRTTDDCCFPQVDAGPIREFKFGVAFTMP